ncbi:hypothetical protein P9112_008275 [Eukaryota sp. TZLM1-RC]
MALSLLNEHVNAVHFISQPITNLSPSYHHCSSFKLINYSSSEELQNLVNSAVSAPDPKHAEYNRPPLDVPWLLAVGHVNVFELIDLCTGIVIRRFIFPTKLTTLVTLFSEYTLLVVIGFFRGDCVAFDPFERTSTLHLNSSGLIVSKFPVTNLCFSLVSSAFFASFADGTIHVFSPKLSKQFKWEPKSTQIVTPILSTRPSSMSKTNPLCRITISTRSVTGFAVCKMNQMSLLWACTLEGKLVCVDIQSGNVIHEHFSNTAFRALALSSDSCLVAVAAEDNIIYLFNSEAKILGRCVGHTNWVTSLKFRPTQDRHITYTLVSVCDGGKMILWKFDVDQGILMDNSIPCSDLNDDHDTPSLAGYGIADLGESLSDLCLLDSNIAVISRLGKIFVWVDID